VFAQRIVAPFNIYKNVVIPRGLYRWTRHQLTYGTAQGHHRVLHLFERFGTYYNGRLNEARIRGRTAERRTKVVGPFLTCIVESGRVWCCVA
jgi:hypothetical protein